MKQYIITEEQIGQLKLNGAWENIRVAVLDSLPELPAVETVKVLCGCGDIYTYPVHDGIVDVGADNQLSCINCAMTDQAGAPAPAEETKECPHCGANELPHQIGPDTCSKCYPIGNPALTERSSGNSGQPPEPETCEFGDYVGIEQIRHGAPNEIYTHKVIGRLRSNSYVPVPVQSPATETLHGDVSDVVACVCCGVSEREVRNYRVADVRPIKPGRE